MANWNRYFEDISDLQEFVSKEMRTGPLAVFSTIQAADLPALNDLLNDLNLSPQVHQLEQPDKISEYLSAIRDGLRISSVCLVADLETAERFRVLLGDVIQSDRTSHTILYVLALPRNPKFDKERLVDLLYVGVYEPGQDTHSEYDSIRHFVRRAFPTFNQDTELASRRIADFIEGLDINTIVDVGCGDGSILLGLAERCKTKFRYFGLDCSTQQINLANERAKAARQRTGGANIQFRPGKFEDFAIDTREYERYALLFLGQTVAHIGPASLDAWLKANSSRRPEYVLFDMYDEWPRYAKDGSTQYFAHALKLMSDESTTSAPRVFTVRQEGRICRGVDISYHDKMGGDTIVRHVLSTSQYPNLIEDYEDVLATHGFEISQPKQYDHAWGRFDIRIANVSRKLPPPGIVWPAPDLTNGKLVNEVWYRTLTSLWSAAEAAKRAGTISGSLVAEIDFFPVAILPFDGDTVWARYVKAHDAEGVAEQISHAWMKLVDRNDKSNSLPRIGFHKPDKMPPYGPGLFDVLMADVPAAFVTSISDTIFPFTLNVHDQRLEALERKVLGAQPGAAFYALPIFPSGMPAFCLVGRSDNLRNVPPLTVMAIFQYEIDKYERFFAARIHEAIWCNFLLECQNMIGFNGLETLADQARWGTSKKWKWKSWVETIPGHGLHDTTRRVEQADDFDAFHRNVLDSLARDCHQQISDLLLTHKFFTPVSRGGCGHELLTRRHRSAAVQLLESLVQIADRYQTAAARKYLKKLAESNDATYPEDDSTSSRPNADYERENLHFQRFKALFCRSDENRGDYRLSPLMAWAFLRLTHSGADLSLAGQSVEEKFEKDKHVYPKLHVQDVWKDLELLNDILQLVGFDSIDINGQRNPDVICIDVKFRRQLHVDVPTAGSSLSPIFELFRKLTTINETAGYVDGFSICFVNQDAPRHEWIKQN